jgi:transcription elongation factor GreB
LRKRIINRLAMAGLRPGDSHIYDWRHEQSFHQGVRAEADFEDEIPVLPAGTKNYITPKDLQRLEDECAQLRNVPKPSRRSPGPPAMATDRKMVTIFTLSGAGDRQKNAVSPQKNENRRGRRSRTANRERVYFGATVVYRNARDEEKTVRIGGIDEARSELNEVSWICPVAKAL